MLIDENDPRLAAIADSAIGRALRWYPFQLKPRKWVTTADTAGTILYTVGWAMGSLILLGLPFPIFIGGSVLMGYLIKSRLHTNWQEQIDDVMSVNNEFADRHHAQREEILALTADCGALQKGLDVMINNANQQAFIAHQAGEAWAKLKADYDRLLAECAEMRAQLEIYDSTNVTVYYGATERLEV